MVTWQHHGNHGNQEVWKVTILKTSLTNGNSSSTRCGSTDTPKQQTSETFVHCMNYHEFTQAQETMAQVGTRHAFWQYTPNQICRSKAADKAFFSRNLCRSRQKSWQSYRLLWRRLWNLLIYQRSSWDILRHIKTADVTSKLWIDTDSITAMRKSAQIHIESCVATWLCKQPDLATERKDTFRDTWQDGKRGCAILQKRFGVLGWAAWGAQFELAIDVRSVAKRCH